MNVVINTNYSISPHNVSPSTMDTSEYVSKLSDRNDDNAPNSKKKKRRDYLTRKEMKLPKVQKSSQSLLEQITAKLKKMTPKQRKALLFSSLSAFQNAKSFIENHPSYGSGNGDNFNVNNFEWYVLQAWADSMTTKQRGELVQLSQMKFDQKELTFQQGLLAKMENKFKDPKSQGMLSIFHLPDSISTKLGVFHIGGLANLWNSKIDAFDSLPLQEQALIIGCVVGGAMLAFSIITAGASALIGWWTAPAEGVVADAVVDATVTPALEGAEDDAVASVGADTDPVDGDAPEGDAVNGAQCDQDDAGGPDAAEDPDAPPDAKVKVKEEDPATTAKATAQAESRGAKFARTFGKIWKATKWTGKNVVKPIGKAGSAGLMAGFGYYMMGQMVKQTTDQQNTVDLSVDADSVNISIKKWDQLLDAATAAIQDENQRVEEASRNMGDLIEIVGRAQNFSV